MTGRSQLLKDPCTGRAFWVEGTAGAGISWPDQGTAAEEARAAWVGMEEWGGEASWLTVMAWKGSHFGVKKPEYPGLCLLVRKLEASSEPIWKWPLFSHKIWGWLYFMR
jgi:hypothetical protein